MPRNVVRNVVGLVVAVVLWAVPTIARAHGGNSDPNVVHACIGNVTKIVRIVGATGSCLSSPPAAAEAPAHWDIHGPQGAPGINGTNGTNGNNGTNGTNGTNGFNGTSVTVSGSLLPGDTHCSNGGVSLFDGSSGNTYYLCNGTDGTTGGGTRVAGPCFDNVNRYVNCQNGTVTDTETGLIWLQQAVCLGDLDWAAANGAAASLKDGDCGLTDGSSPGDWRLPTKDEWIATMAHANAIGCATPTLTNDAETDCQTVGPSSFAGVPSSFPIYWSGSSYLPTSSPLGNASVAWFADLGSGDVFPFNRLAATRVWPVRDGSR